MQAHEHRDGSGPVVHGAGLDDRATAAGIDDRGLAALRVAATLVHAVPRLRARIRHGAQVLVDVRPSPLVGADQTDEPLRLTPCAFRGAVAQAWRQHEAGHRLSFLGLPAGVVPAIDVGTPPGGTARPGGLYRVPLEDRWLWAFATTLDAPAAFNAGRTVVERCPAGPDVRALGLRPDRGTGVTIVYAETVADPASAVEGALVEVLESLLARYATVELLGSIAADGDADAVAGGATDW